MLIIHLYPNALILYGIIDSQTELTALIQPSESSTNKLNWEIILYPLLIKYSCSESILKIDISITSVTITVVANKIFNSCNISRTGTTSLRLNPNRPIPSNFFNYMLFIYFYLVKDLQKFLLTSFHIFVPVMDDLSFFINDV